jgi:hypothetical protein
MDFTVNYLAVLIAAIVAFIVGFLWHGPLFGRQWLKLTGVTDKQMQEMKAKGMGPMAPQMIGALVQQLVTAFVLAVFISKTGAAGVSGALLIAFWAWLGFIATALLNGVLWEKRTPALYCFTVVYQLVNLGAMALVLGLWK